MDSVYGFSIIYMEQCIKDTSTHPWSIRAGVQADVVPLALEYQRTLRAKQANFGISLLYSCVICLHLAADKLGKNVDLKWMVRMAGANTHSLLPRKHYLETYQNAERMLQITNEDEEKEKSETEAAAKTKREEDFEDKLLEEW